MEQRISWELRVLRRDPQGLNAGGVAAIRLVDVVGCQVQDGTYSMSLEPSRIERRVLGPEPDPVCDLSRHVLKLLVNRRSQQAHLAYGFELGHGVRQLLAGEAALLSQGCQGGTGGRRCGNRLQDRSQQSSIIPGK